MKNNSALLLIDIQNDYFENGANPLVGSNEASINVKQILDNFRGLQLPVIHIQHFSFKPNATFFRPQTIGVEIHKNVYPLKSEKVFIKNYPNCFRETELNHFLRGKELQNLVVCGMMTHMCVDTTVRAAYDLGFDITLISDACATKDLAINGITVKATDVQTAYLAALNGTFARVKSTETFLKEFITT